MHVCNAIYLFFTFSHEILHMAICSVSVSSFSYIIEGDVVVTKVFQHS